MKNTSIKILVSESSLHLAYFYHYLGHKIKLALFFLSLVFKRYLVLPIQNVQKPLVRVKNKIVISNSYLHLIFSF